jgi:hypothetical protein
MSIDLPAGAYDASQTPEKEYEWDSIQKGAAGKARRHPRARAAGGAVRRDRHGRVARRPVVVAPGVSDAEPVVVEHAKVTKLPVRSIFVTCVVKLV